MMIKKKGKLIFIKNVLFNSINKDTGYTDWLFDRI